jgi:hypothetical protein
MTGHPHLDAQRRSEERWAKQHAWALKALPDEEPAFVVGAIWSVQKTLGLGPDEAPPPDAVRQRLRDQGKDKATLEEDA